MFADVVCLKISWVFCGLISLGAPGVAGRVLTLDVDLLLSIPSWYVNIHQEST